MESAGHLAENLERVPVIVIPTIWGVHDGSGKPGLFDSVIQSAWSFCLALRARGLGSAWTTLHLGKAKEFAELLGIPKGVTQVVMLPVASCPIIHDHNSSMSEVRDRLEPNYSYM